MKRYDEWHHTIYLGDRALAQSYLGQGRKFLGAVAEELRATGLFQGKRYHKTANGVVFIAQIKGKIPELTIDARAVGGDKEPVRILEGFVVRPSPDAGQEANADLNHVILPPNWKGFFFDAAHVPVSVTSYGIYGPLLPEGYLRYGEVDWRDAGETALVSFHGPQARYFGNLNEFGERVYHKGQVLFDMPTVEPALTGASFGFIRGACLRGADAGLCLFVIATYNGMRDVVLRVPVRITPAAAKILARAGTPGKWQLASALEVVPGAAALVGSFDHTSTETGHPWHFNQAGTEARIIRRSGSGTVEQIIAIDAAGTTATYSEVAYAARSRTASIVTTGSSVHDSDVLTDTWSSSYVHVQWAVGGAYSGNSVVTTGGTGSIAGDPSYHNVVVYEYTRTDSAPVSAWIPCAVDFRDNVPVYGECPIALTQEHVTAALDIDYNHTTTRVQAINSVVSTGDPVVINITETDTFTTDAAATRTAERTAQTVVGGLRTDWDEVLVFSESTQTVTATVVDDCVHVASFTQDGFATSPGGAGGDKTLSFEPSPTWSDSYSGTLTHEYGSVTTALTRQFAPMAIDLRYKVLAYLVSTDELVTTVTQSKSAGAATAVGVGYWAIDPSTEPTAFTGTAAMQITVNDFVLHEFDDLWTTSSGTVSEAGHSPAGLSRDRMAFYPKPPPTMPNLVSKLEDAPFAPSSSSSSATQAPLLPAHITDVMAEGSATFLTRDLDGMGNTERVGSVATYKDGYCFSVARYDGGVTWEAGNGSVVDGQHDTTLVEATGADPDYRYHPITVLTPTAVPR